MTELDGLYCVLTLQAHGATPAPRVLEFVAAVKNALGIHGGYSHPVSDDRNQVSISFDPETVEGGLAQIVSFLREFGEQDNYFEWSITLKDAS